MFIMCGQLSPLELSLGERIVSDHGELKSIVNKSGRSAIAAIEHVAIQPDPVTRLERGLIAFDLGR